MIAQQVERDERVLRQCPTLQEQHLVPVGNREQAAQTSLGILRDGDELLAAMAHLHDRHARAVPVQELVARALEQLLRRRGGPRAEVVDPGHCSVGVPGASPPSSSDSVSTTRSRPASFSPSPRLMSVTPCVERPISRIAFTGVRISTPRLEISITSSSGRTSAAATTWPLRSDCWIAIMPLVPRP